MTLTIGAMAKRKTQINNGDLTMSKAITINGKKYTSTTIKGISQRIGTAGAKRDADITELASACAVQAASGNLNWFNDYLLTTPGFLHSITGKPTVEGKAVIAYLKLVYPAVEFDDAAKAFDYVEGANREKYFNGEIREKKGKKIKVKVAFDDDFSGFPLTFGAFKNEWHESKPQGNDNAPMKAKSVCSRLTKITDTLNERGIDHTNLEQADVEAVRKALDAQYRAALAALEAAQNRAEKPSMDAVEQLQGVVGGGEKRADADRAAHAETAGDLETRDHQTALAV